MPEASVIVVAKAMFIYKLLLLTRTIKPNTIKAGIIIKVDFIHIHHVKISTLATPAPAATTPAPIPAPVQKSVPCEFNSSNVTSLKIIFSYFPPPCFNLPKDLFGSIIR